ncbi:hypothetical protein [Vibrio sp. ER1A]|uniref:hypothetical protein n=1 Tax=Vibrio sp. ER1A TaxID=1517681 RepID=UPI000690CB10|nr:hypothetical protein [Vibrio sp. ER1A]
MTSSLPFHYLQLSSSKGRFCRVDVLLLASFYGLASSPKNDISLVLRSERDYEQAKAELAFLEENLSELSASDIDAFYQRVAELSHAIEIWESIQTEPGFTIAKDSNITPQELAQSGFVMKDFKFYPSDFSEVKKRVEFHLKNGTLNDSFVILDVSASNERVYSFDRCPF